MQGLYDVLVGGAIPDPEARRTEEEEEEEEAPGVDKIREELEECEQENRDVRQQLADRSKEIDRLRGEKDAIRNQLNQMKTDLRGIYTSVTQKAPPADAPGVLESGIRDAVQRLLSELDKARDQIDNKQAELDRALTKVQQLEQQPHFPEAFEWAQQEITRLRREVRDANDALRQARRAMQTADLGGVTLPGGGATPIAGSTASAMARTDPYTEGAIASAPLQQHLQSINRAWNTVSNHLAVLNAYLVPSPEEGRVVQGTPEARHARTGGRPRTGDGDGAPAAEPTRTEVAARKSSKKRYDPKDKWLLFAREVAGIAGQKVSGLFAAPYYKYAERAADEEYGNVVDVKEDHFDARFYAAMRSAIQRMRDVLQGSMQNVQEAEEIIDAGNRYALSLFASLCARLLADSENVASARPTLNRVPDIVRMDIQKILLALDTYTFSKQFGGRGPQITKTRPQGQQHAPMTGQTWQSVMFNMPPM